MLIALEQEPTPVRIRVELTLAIGSVYRSIQCLVSLDELRWLGTRVVQVGQPTHRQTPGRRARGGPERGKPTDASVRFTLARSRWRARQQLWRLAHVFGQGATHVTDVVKGALDGAPGSLDALRRANGIARSRPNTPDLGHFTMLVVGALLVVEDCIEPRSTDRLRVEPLVNVFRLEVDDRAVVPCRCDLGLRMISHRGE